MADCNNMRPRKIVGRQVTTGSSEAGDADGAGDGALFKQPWWLALDERGRRGRVAGARRRRAGLVGKPGRRGDSRAQLQKLQQAAAARHRGAPSPAQRDREGGERKNLFSTRSSLALLRLELHLRQIRSGAGAGAVSF